MKIERLEGEAFKLMQQPCFLINRDEMGLITEALGRLD